MALGTVIATVFYALRRAQKRVLPTTTIAINNYVVTHRRATHEVSAAADEYCAASLPQTRDQQPYHHPMTQRTRRASVRRCSPNTISATEQCRSFLTAARIPSNTNGSASTQLGSVASFAFRVDCIVRCMLSTNPFACGCYDVVVLVDVRSSDAFFSSRARTRTVYHSHLSR